MSNPVLRLKASMEPPGLTQGLTNSKQESIIGTQNGSDLFNEMKHQFLSFKRQKFLENLECYENLAKSQAPKFMVIACADSSVCPSYILGFQPGEAFVVRNVANLVPPFENGPTETNAALEFAVNSLEVENILVIGHSCCGGIRALMSMQDDVNSSFTRSWVVVGKNARLSTKTVASNLSFDQQCRHCEKYYTYSGEAGEEFDRDDNTLTLIKPSPMPSKDIRRPLEIGSVHGGNNGVSNSDLEEDKTE
ncbi:unnamed protein product [Camellia sinensis]